MMIKRSMLQKSVVTTSIPGTKVVEEKRNVSKGIVAMSYTSTIKLTVSHAIISGE
jgi:hypothetical protein